MELRQHMQNLSPSGCCTAAEIAGRSCPACGLEIVSLVGELNGWALLQCFSCRLVYTKELPPPERLAEVYEDAYQHGGLYDMHMKQLAMMVRTRNLHQGFYRNQVFLKRYKPSPGDKMLEIGCGIGAFLIAAKQCGWQVEGVDISSRALEASAKIHGLPVHHGTLEELAFPPDSYKAIVCWEVLEHLASPQSFLARVRSLLRKDGIFVCSVPNTGRRVPDFCRTPGQASVPPVHLNFWTVDSFREFANSNGFRVLLLFPKRSLRGMAGGSEQPLRLLLNQIGALLHFREGDTIFAVLEPA